ncbi:hypothetical protein FJY71_06465, partial [candidate division WOR-3 bacterium]|nr:hypothetical protein [candidate division WOR-3 bacterium]
MPACPRCGTAFIHGQRFCIRCGSELAGPPGHGLPPDLAARVDIYEKRIDQDPLKPGLYLELGDAYREYR